METTQENTHKKTLAAMLGIDVEEITPTNWGGWGLQTFDANGGEYAIGTDARRKVRRRKRCTHRID